MIGRTVGDWQLVGRIGDEEEAGVRYEATHARAPARRATVLVLHRALAPPLDARTRFVENAAAAARVRHDHLAPVIGGDIEGDGTAWIALEPIAGRRLTDLLVEGPLDLDRTSAVALEVASGLAAAHAQGFFHRHLSPERLLLVDGEDGVARVLVADFALARLVSLGEDSAARMLGSPAYRAPEEWRAAEVDGRADVYALGAILFECLAGRPPFTARTSQDWRRAHLEQPPPDLARAADVPAALAALVGRMLEKRRSPRPRTMDEVVVILKSIRAKGGRAMPRSTMVAPDGGVGALARSQHDAATVPAEPVRAAGLEKIRGRAAVKTAIAPTQQVDPLAPSASGGLAQARSRMPFIVGVVALVALTGGGMLALNARRQKAEPEAAVTPPVVPTAQAAPSTSPPPEPQARPAQYVPPKVPPEVVSLEHDADEAIAARDWERAIAHCDKALVFDPKNEDVKERRDRAAREAKAKTLYDAFRIAVDGGQADMALQLYGSIPEGSVYRAEAAPAVEALRRNLPARRSRSTHGAPAKSAAPAKPAEPRDPMPAMRNLKDPFSSR